MIRLRIALGIASSLVAVAALTIVFAGTGEAQGPNVVVTNTPLPVTGNVTATLAGNVSANIINPANNPVLIRDVDRQRAKNLWQENKNIIMSEANGNEAIDFAAVPLRQALVIEHINVRVTELSQPNSPPPNLLALSSTQPFGESSVFDDFRFLVTQPFGGVFIADAVTKFYVAPGESPRLLVTRGDFTGSASVIVLATGYFVSYP